MITKILTYYEPVFDSDEHDQTSSVYFDMETCLDAAKYNIESGLVNHILILDGDGNTVKEWDASTGIWN